MHSVAQNWFFGSALRQVRLASGAILFVYVLTHLLDHALCNASWQAADSMLAVQNSSGKAWSAPRCCMARCWPT